MFMSSIYKQKKEVHVREKYKRVYTEEESSFDVHCSGNVLLKPFEANIPLRSYIIK